MFIGEHTPLSIDAPGSEHNSAGYTETQEKSIDDWPGTLTYAWAFRCENGRN